MRYRSGSPSANMSGLVPMADMLSNTVGIMLFILAFTVLQTGGALIPKRLPIERDSADRKPVYFVCLDQRLLPLDSTLNDRLIEGLGKPTYKTIQSWVAGFNRARAEDSFFTVEPKGEVRYDRGAFQSRAELVLLASYRPKTMVGDTRDILKTEASLFDQKLRAMSKEKRFCYFMVYANSIDLFREARDYAESQYGIGSGWSPATEGKPITFNLSGSGGGIAPIDQ